MCKLMATIGLQLDSSPKAQEKMQAYFVRIERWSTNTQLESRLRFMLKASPLLLCFLPPEIFIQVCSLTGEQSAPCCSACPHVQALPMVQ